MVACCAPGLERLSLVGKDVMHAAFEADADQDLDGSWPFALRPLTGLSCLTALSLGLQEAALTPLAWRNLARLTGLHALTLDHVFERCSAGLLRLTSCKQLTALHASFDDGDPEPVDFHILSQVSGTLCYWLSLFGGSECSISGLQTYSCACYHHSSFQPAHSIMPLHTITLILTGSACATHCLQHVRYRPVKASPLTCRHSCLLSCTSVR